MVRRKVYPYGDALPASPFGHVDMAFGKNVAAGDVGIQPLTRVIMEPIEELEIDGVHMVFQNTPGTEAPAEMNTWFPDFNALWLAENLVAGLHNVLTRGVNCFVAGAGSSRPCPRGDVSANHCPKGRSSKPIFFEPRDNIWTTPSCTISSA
jgi:alkyl sulfatase BDS1-like metallo-beta-lactamase superfamily hydrolase